MTTLANALSRSVDAGVRKRGTDYLRQGRVKLIVCTAKQAQANVSGSETYRVLLDRESKRLRVSCSCPFFKDRDEVCKHIWAALLAADLRRGLRGPGGSLPRALVTRGAPAPRPATTAAKPARKALPMPRGPEWRELLKLLPATAPPVQEPADSILYILESRDTLPIRQLTLDLQRGRRNADGSWGFLKPLRLGRAEVSTLPDPADQEILSILVGSAPARVWNPWDEDITPFVPSLFELSGPNSSLLFPRLCATGRFLFRNGSNPLTALSWGGEGAWELWLDLEDQPGGDSVLRGSMRRGEERLPLDEPALLLQSGHLIAGGQVARFDTRGLQWLPLLNRAGWALPVPAADREALVTRLFSAPTLPHLALPEALHVEEVRLPPQPLLRLAPPDPWSKDLHAELSCLYEDREVLALSQGRGIYREADRRFFLRDTEAERRAYQHLKDLGFRLADGPATSRTLRIPASRTEELLPALLSEGWAVESAGRPLRTSGALRLGVTSASSVSSGIDWFELRGEAEFGSVTVGLPELLAALSRGETSVPLDDGSLGMVPADWVRKLKSLAKLGRAEDDHLRFSIVQATLLDIWLDDQPEVSWDEAFENARRRLRRFDGIEPAEAPPQFQGELREYQRLGLGWLHFLRDFGFGGCLADDMGLGKTVQVLALLEARRAMRKKEKLPPSLAVVPRSLVFNWLAEAARFTPQLRVLDHTGVSRSRDENPFAEADLVLITYGTLRRDIAKLKAVDLDYVILDEAQAIKNADSQTAKAARLLQGRHRLALSGTPIENHLGELWSLLEFLNPGLLGASSILSAGSAEMREPASGMRTLLARAVKPFILRRTKEQVAPELPAKMEQTLVCELPAKQRRLYNELRDHYRNSLGARIGAQGLGRTKILVLEALLRLRQAACHPGLLDPKRIDEPCAKLDLLLPQLREITAEGHKVLVFSQFTSFLAILRRQLDAEKLPYLYLDGRTRDRQDKVEQFQSDPAYPLFLISLKAGGLGLNLTAADYVYLLDPWWNPAVEAQAIDRAHRIGQTRPVFASRIVAQDTVEEKILELQRSKRELADAIIQGDQSLIASLSREDLELLLS